MNALAAKFPKFAGRLLIVCLCISLLAASSRATTVVPPQFDELVNESDYIVRALIKSVKAEWRENKGQRFILTLVEVDIQEVISGTPPMHLVLEILGGHVGNEMMVVDSVPEFKVGQEDILFIRGNGRQFCPLTALTHGRYPVIRENGRALINRSNHVPLHETAEVSLPMEEAVTTERETTQSKVPAMELESFVQQIRSAKNVNYRRSTRTAR